MQLYAIQPDICWHDRQANFQQVHQLLAEVSPTPGSLLVLPELFSTGFSMDLQVTTEDPDGPTPRFLATLAASSHCTVIAGLAQAQADGSTRNEAWTVDSTGTCVARYAKRHLFSPGNEDQHYRPGNDPVVVPLGQWKLSMHVCYDLRFPEDFRQSVRQDADLFVVIANWPAVRQDHWISLLTARAIENQAYVLGVNRCGSDPALAYQGGTRLLAPNGSTVMTLADQPGVLEATLDHATVVEERRTFPVLRDFLR